MMSDIQLYIVPQFSQTQTQRPQLAQPTGPTHGEEHKKGHAGRQLKTNTLHDKRPHGHTHTHTHTHRASMWELDTTPLNPLTCH